MVPRHIPIIGRVDDGSGYGRVFAVLGALLMVLFWFGLGYNPSPDMTFQSSPSHLGPGAGQAGSLISVMAAALGIGGLCLLLFQVVRWQRHTAALLRQREAELAEQRARMRRYVADLERIADVAAHELQEPLRRMVSYSQLLAAHDSARNDDEIKDYAGQVIDGARRMRALVSGLREFVSVDSIPRTGEVSSALGAMVIARQRLAEVLAEAGVSLVVDPLPEVEADQASLVEIFSQLLGNAVRYRAPQRRPVIHVSVVRDGGMARITVRDNGVGIEPARLVRMFEIFYRPHDAGTERDTPAIGTGLAVVRRLVERLGGEVWVESEKGVGSSFGFSLRLGDISLGRGGAIRAA